VRTVTRLELNRTLLARQLLLERRRLPVPRALEAVGGLQAQDPLPPLLALWTRLDGFGDGQLRRSLDRRSAVRGTLMRGTVHLVSARDYLQLAGALEPLVRTLHRRYMRGRGDVPNLARATREAIRLAHEPISAVELRRRFGEDGWWRIRREARFLYAPVDGERSGFGRRAVFVAADAWLGRKPAPARESLPHLVRRGLAAVGPLSVADLSAWSGLSAATLRPIVERLRLRRLTSEDGRELLDLPRARLVRGDVSPPPRLLPGFDNAILSHADRTRIVDDEARRAVIRGGLVDPVFLLDGFVHGRWRIERAKRTATIVLEPFGPVPRRHVRALREEAERMLAFAEPDADRHTVRRL
jgi:hypothetical protein